jgi:hypothetical protein
MNKEPTILERAYRVLGRIAERRNEPTNRTCCEEQGYNCQQGRSCILREKTINAQPARD